MVDLIYNGVIIPRSGPPPDQCTPMQGKLALGESNWSTIMAFYNAPTTTWGMRTTIDGASVWYRNSQALQLIAHLLNFSQGQIDDTFRIAVLINE